VRSKRNTRHVPRRAGLDWASFPRPLLLCLLLLSPPRARADSVVTNCSQSALVAALATGSTITFTQNCSIALSSTITITTNVTLDASGRTVTINGNNAVQLFAVPPGVKFTLKGLTLSAGQSTGGGALYISPGAEVLVTNCLFGGNGAVGANGVAGNDGNDGGTVGQNGSNGTTGSQALGGAIYNLGILTALNSQFLTNRATGGTGGGGGNGGDGVFEGGNGGNGGAGALGHGGAIYSQGTLRVTNCTFSGNTASGGSGGDGGAAGAGAFAGNAGRGGAGATGSGAAVYSAQSVTAVNCTFSSNAARSGNSTAGGTDSSGNGMDGPRGADSFGGGVFSQGSGTFVNCTLYNNTAAGGNGGNGGDADPNGIHTAGNGGNGGNGTGGGLYNTGAVAVVNCTFSSCGATGGTNGVAGSAPFPASDGTPGRGRGGEIAQGSGYLVLQNSILAASSAGTNAYDTSASRITDGGFNISSDASLNLSGTSRKNTDPKVASLADNGGPTQTIALQSGSPAIDAVPRAVSTETDQRGVLRPQGAACDAGAYELVTVPAIVVQPQSQTNANSTRVTFTVSALGGSLSYQWRFNAAAITSATAASYTISSVDQTNEGTYTVVITNSYGSITSAQATLTVIFPPVIKLQPASLTVPAGSNAAFTVTASSVEPLAYQWQLNGANIQAATGTGAAGDTSFGFTVTNAQAADAGTYTVVIANTYDSVTSSPATLTVYVPPLIDTQPANQTAIVGSNAIFSVVALGTPPLRYQWRFNQTAIASNATSSAYALTSVQASNAGSYDVVITNGFGATTSRTATLTIVYPFTISGQVFDPSGTNGLPGVKLSAGTNSVVTDPTGNYLFSGLSSNIYTVTASLDCYVFGPTNREAKVGPTNAFGVNFFATNDFHSVSGWITNGPPSVTVAVTGTNGTRTVPGSGGVYGVSNLCAGFYLVVPSQPGYQFQPPTNSILVPPDTNSVNFTAVQVFGISGQITRDSDGSGFSGITVAISGSTATNVITGDSGVYLLGGLQPGTFQVTPIAPACYHLNLPNRTVTLGPTNANGTDFVALRDAYTISGRLTNGAAGVSGITVNAGGTNSALTDTNGLYVLSNLCAGAYTVTPSASCYQFNPASLPAAVGPGNATGLDFSTSPLVYTISGRVTDAGIGVSNVTIQAGNQTTNADSSGNYVLSGLCPGSYTVTPTQACRIFNPSSIPVTLGPNTAGVNFLTFSDDLSRIRGQITDSVTGLSNVLVTATGGRTTITDASGNYAFSSLCPGSYTITPSVANRCLTAPSLTVAVGSAQTVNGVDFAATPAQYYMSGTLVGMPPGPKVTVSIAGPTATNFVVTATGAYGISNLCPGAYTVTPSNACYQFYPSSWTTTLGPSDESLDFAVSGGGAFSIAGWVTHNGVALSNVTVTVAGQTNLTGASGNYAFPYLCPGFYPVTASAPNYQFEPATNYVTLASADSNDVNFAAVALVSLSGRIVQGASGLPGVKVSAGTNISFTRVGGYYTNLNLREGANVLVVPSLDAYAFAPASQSVTVQSNTSGVDFMAFPSLALARASNGVVQLAFAPAFTCQVEVSTNFSNWQPVFATNNISTSTLLLEFTDTNAANLPLRFYRVAETFGGPLVLTNLTATNRSVSFGCVAATVVACQIQASTNLTSWTNIFSTNLPAAAPLRFGYHDATDLPARFYRLSQTPGF
jgi:hypothetical protein